MKHAILWAAGFLLSGCGSDASTNAPDVATAAAPAPSVTANPDPRVATMRQQHEKLLSLEKEYVAQLSQLTGYEKLSPERIKKEVGHYATLTRKSQANIDALNMLDASKASEPAQIALVNDLAAQQGSLLEKGERYLKGIHDLHYLDKVRH
jgi:hypothetical protein